MLSAAVFFGVALLAFAGALTLVFHRNPVVAVLGMAVAMVGLGVLYMLLAVPFLGLFLMIVYAGAVMVILLYVIMALGLQEEGPPVGTAQTVLTYAAAALFIAHLYRLTRETVPALFGPVESAFGTIQAFGHLLVSRYAVPFEVASLLLVGAMVGAIVLSRREWT
jgi:NADH-quinone oxidoreductase subunit J